VEAGLDSMRVSLNSARPHYYAAYFRPHGYGLQEVRTAIQAAKSGGARVALNYLIFPGVSDVPPEVAALEELIASTGIDLLQLRNLNIDPDYYLHGMKFPPNQKPMGVRNMINRLHKAFPSLRFGYFNPPWRDEKAVDPALV